MSDESVCFRRLAYRSSDCGADRRRNVISLRVIIDAKEHAGHIELRMKRERIHGLAWKSPCLIRAPIGRRKTDGALRKRDDVVLMPELRVKVIWKIRE